MVEYFVITQSNAAPMVSDTHKEHIEADDSAHALNKAIENYRHPCGLYWVGVFESADAFHKDESPIVRWESERCKEHLKFRSEEYAVVRK